MRTIITVITGAIIGYITNWLAIKMLFRPHNEKRFLGVKVPFTPGLIPKEKSRIAKSVGDAIGNHLLTKETMVESLCNDKINKQLEAWVYNKIHNLAQCNITLGEKVKGILGDKFQIVHENLNKNLNEYVLKNIKSQNTKDAVAQYIINYIEEELNNNPKILTENHIYNELNKKVLEIVMKYKNTQIASTKVQNILMDELKNLENSSLKLQDVFPESAVNNLKVYMFNKKEQISETIKNMLNEEKSQIKIKQIVTEAMDKNLNPMIAMFLNKDSIHEKTMNIINEFMDKEENKQQIIVILGEVIDKILEKEINDIVLNSSEQGKEETAKAISNLIVDKCITEENLVSIENQIKDKIHSVDSLKDIVSKLNENYYEDLNNFIHRKVEILFESDFLCGKIQNIVNNTINSIMNKPIKDIFDNNEDCIKEYAYDMAKGLYNRFIENEAEAVVEALDIASIVEDKINSFDVAFAEEIILEIASKELNAITWLGGLLGAIMGLVSSLISVA